MPPPFACLSEGQFGCTQRVSGISFAHHHRCCGLARSLDSVSARQQKTACVYAHLFRCSISKVCRYYKCLTFSHTSTINLAWRQTVLTNTTILADKSETKSNSVPLTGLHAFLQMDVQPRAGVTTVHSCAQRLHCMCEGYSAVPKPQSVWTEHLAQPHSRINYQEAELNKNDSYPPRGTPEAARMVACPRRVYGGRPHLARHVAEAGQGHGYMSLQMSPTSTPVLLSWFTHAELCGSFTQ